MKIGLLTAAALMLPLASEAHACMSVHLPETILLKGPPNRVPDGYSLLKVRANRIDERGWRLRAVLLQPEQARQLGSVVLIEPNLATSCTAIGPLGAEAHVVARPISISSGRTVLQPAIYGNNEGWLWSWFLRWLSGDSFRTS